MDCTFLYTVETLVNAAEDGMFAVIEDGKVTKFVDEKGKDIKVTEWKGKKKD